MDETTEIEPQQTETQISEIKLVRLGDTSKCPVCGTQVDQEAFCCPKCRNYFCYHCRARLSAPDEALQCRNRDCEYYGKLVCGDCDPAHDKQDAPTEYLEPVDGYWPLWLLVTIIAGAVTWYSVTAIAGAIVFLGLYLGLGYIMQSAGCNIFGKERLVALQRVSKFRTCIHCNQPAKVVPLQDRR